MDTSAGPTPLSQIALYHLVRRSPERGSLRRRLLELFESSDGTFLSIPVARRARIHAQGEVVGARVELLGLLSLKAVLDRPLPNGLHVLVELESAIAGRWYSFRARLRGAAASSETARLQLVAYVDRFDERAADGERQRRRVPPSRRAVSGRRRS